MSIAFQPSYSTPPEFLSWFSDVLAKQGTDIQLFSHPETELEIGVFLPTLQNKERILYAWNLPYPLPPPPLSSSQEYGSDLDSADLDEVYSTANNAASKQGKAGDLVYKTTSRNRKQLRKLAEKKAQREGGGGPGRDRVTKSKSKSKSKSKRSAPRRKPLSASRVTDSGGEGEEEEEVVEEEEEEEEEEEGGEEERQQQPRRQRRQKQALSVDPWFDTVIKEESIQIKPSLQAKMRKSAMAIASRRAVEDWQDFFRCWREKGLLTSRPTSRNSAFPLVRLETLPGAITNFYQAYDEVRTADTATSFKAITYRCRMVRLFELYHYAEVVPIPDEPPPQQGQTRQAQRKRFLFNLLHPGLEGIKDVMKNEASKADWNTFTKRLSAATRWQMLADKLGYGVLGLIPESLVANTWVQRGMTDPEFAIWIRAIPYFNPKCQAACRYWGRELIRAIAGHHPSRKKRILESVGDKALSGYEDPQLLFCEEVGPSSSGEENTQPNPRPRLDSGNGLFSFVGEMDQAWPNQQIALTRDQQTMLDNLNLQQLEELAVSFPSQLPAASSWSGGGGDRGTGGEEEYPGL
jgi:hypothetical protein